MSNCLFSCNCFCKFMDSVALQSTTNDGSHKYRVNIEFRLINFKLAGGVVLSEFSPEVSAKYTKWENENKERIKNNKPELPMAIDAGDYCFYPVHLWTYLDNTYTNRVSEHRILDKILHQELNKSRITYPSNLKHKHQQGQKDCHIDVPQTFTIKVAGDISNISKVRIDSSLCFSLFVNVLGESGTLCLQDYGVATLNIADLIKNRQLSNGDITVDLRLHTTDNNEATSSITISHPIVTVSLEGKDIEDYATSIANSKKTGVNAKLSDTLDSSSTQLNEYNCKSFVRANDSDFFMPDMLCNNNVTISSSSRVGAREDIKSIMPVVQVKNLQSLIEKPPFKETRNIKQNMDFVQKMMTHYTNGYMDFEKKVMVEVIKGSEDINCPSNPSEETFFESNTLQIPLAAFVMSDPLQTELNYWFRALDIYASHFLTLYLPSVLPHNMYDTHRGDYIDFIGKLFCRQIMADAVDADLYIKNVPPFFDSSFNESKSKIAKKCSVGIGLIVQYAQMLDYNSDYTYDAKRKTKCFIESFGNAICAHNGDCEDLGHANYQFFKAFISIKLEEELKMYKRKQSAPGSYRDTQFGSRGIDYCNLLLDIQAVLRWYIPFLVIEGVTASNVQGAENKKNNEEELIVNGAHASLKLIPYPYLQECLMRSPDEMKEAMVPLFLAVDKKILDLRTNTSKSHGILENLETLPILIGEGTGIMEGGLFGEPSQTSGILRNFVYSSAALEKAKKPIILQDRSISPFYKTLLFGVTDVFIETLGIGTFHFAEQLENGKFQRSCLYSNIIKKSRKVVIIPNLYHSINTRSNDNTREFSNEMIELMHSVAKSRVPTPTIMGSKQYPINAIFTFNKDTLLSILSSRYTKMSEKNDAAELLEAIAFTENISKDKVISDRLGRRNVENPDGIISVFVTRGNLTSELFKNLLDFVANYRSAKTQLSENDGLVKMYIIGKVNIFKEYLDEAYFVYRLDFYCFGYNQNGNVDLDVYEDEQGNATL